MSRVSQLAEQLAALSARNSGQAEQVEARLERVNRVIRNMGETGLLRHHVLLGRSFTRPYCVEWPDQSSGQVVQAALLVPEGFGVCYFDTEDYDLLTHSHETAARLESEARSAFRPSDQCSADEKVFLGQLIEPMLEDLADLAMAEASRLETGSDLTLQEYFGRSNARADDNT